MSVASKKIIAFSLWGDNPKYTVGAIRNAELAPTVYPGWTARFYCGTSVSRDIIDQLRLLAAEVVEMNVSGDWTGMFWRFQAISDPEVEIMISRDTDSRLTLREAAAVESWLRSDKNFHIMRDHPWHGTEILGGMWGARKPILKDMNVLIDSYYKQSFWQVDQKFLREIIWPRVAGNCTVHDPFFQKIDFPVDRRGYEFVGQIWDENEVTVDEHVQVLKRHIEGKDK